MNDASWLLYPGLFVASLIGSAAGAYFKRRVENLATHDDLDKLVEQMAAVTQTTENIKAAISDDVWDRQEQWKLKRDAVLEAMRSIAAIKESLANLHVCFGGCLPESEALKQKRTVEPNAFKERNSTLWCAKFVAEIVVGSDLNKHIYQFYQEATQIAVMIMKEGNSGYFNSPQVQKTLADKTDAVIREARKELGMPDREDLIMSDIDH